MNSLWLFWFSSYCTVHYNSKQNRRSYVTRHRQDPPAEMKKHSCDKNCSTSKHRRRSSDNFLLKFTTWKMVFVSKSVYLIRRKRLSLLWSLALLGDDSQLWVMVFGWDLRGLRSELQKTEEDGSRVTRRGLGLGCVCVCVCLFSTYFSWAIITQRLLPRGQFSQRSGVKRENETVIFIKKWPRLWQCVSFSTWEAERRHQTRSLCDILGDISFKAAIILAHRKSQ